ncbi:MAG: hypothetical protein U9M89_02825 [Patescibacteria group bacterium]|nr:hypothetical protein [Patescibacteria group bacterium]
MADTYKRLSDTEVEVTSTKVSTISKEHIQTQIDTYTADISKATAAKQNLEAVLTEFDAAPAGEGE